MGLGCSCNFQSVRRTGFLLLEVMTRSQKCLTLLFQDVLEQCEATGYGYGFSRNTMSSLTLATNSVYQNYCDFITFTGFGLSKAFCSHTSLTHFTVNDPMFILLFFYKIFYCPHLRTTASS